ncbi:MAG: hypothetical protein ACE5GU_09600 [Candidatus Scalinduaceae bacterium]
MNVEDTSPRELPLNEEPPKDNKKKPKWGWININPRRGNEPNNFKRPHVDRKARDLKKFEEKLKKPDQFLKGHGKNHRRTNKLKELRSIHYDQLKLLNKFPQYAPYIIGHDIKYLEKTINKVGDFFSLLDYLMIQIRIYNSHRLWGALADKKFKKALTPCRSRFDNVVKFAKHQWRSIIEMSVILEKVPLGKFAKLHSLAERLTTATGRSQAKLIKQIQNILKKSDASSLNFFKIHYSILKENAELLKSALRFIRRYDVRKVLRKIEALENKQQKKQRFSLQLLISKGLVLYLLSEISQSLACIYPVFFKRLSYFWNYWMTNVTNISLRKKFPPHVIRAAHKFLRILNNFGMKP